MTCKPDRTQTADGYLTVYAALSLTVLLSLFMALLEGVRIHTLQLEAQLITDIAADSVLAEYHREMFKQYGMFWIDTSYGTQTPSVEKLKARMEWYVGKNCDMEVFAEDYLYRDFLGIGLENIEVVKMGVASDLGGRFFRQRAVEAIKDDIGITFLEQVWKWVDTVEKYGLMESSLEQEKQQADSEIAGLNGQEKQVGEDWITIQVQNPTVPIEEMKRKGVLNLVLEDAGAVSARSVDLRQLISQRKAREGINQGNWEAEEESLTDRLFWLEYLVKHCAFYGQEQEKCALKYQLEYVIAGESNDTDNLKEVIHRISLIREAANALYLYSDETKCAEAEAAAALISAAIMLPETQPVFKTVIMLGWAYAESLYDVKCLLEGQKVPLLKTADTWHYSIGSALGDMDLSKDSEKDSHEDSRGSGLRYEDYLRILLLLSPLEEQTFRVMDIVEMDIRQTPGNAYFRMDGCVDRLVMEVTINSNRGYTVPLYKNKQY